MAELKLLVGLGNPGDGYKKNRHNVGFEAIEQIIDAWELQGTLKYEAKFEARILKIGRLVMMEPQTFMNESGRSVRKVKDYYDIPLDSVYVFHDDLDIVLGEHKIMWGKGPKVHNGINSVVENLGTTEFWRVRIGVDNREIHEEDAAISGADYVLGNFRSTEKEIVTAVIGKIAAELKNLNG
jgi:PTH1 family peptidyl-tRNA hydrolase